MMAACRRIDVVADVPEKYFQIVCVANAQPDASGDADRRRGAIG